MKTLSKIIALSLLAQACGSSSGSSDKTDQTKTVELEEQEPAVHSMSLKDRSKLPICTTQIETSLAYIKAEKIFVVCEDEKWVKTTIEIDSKEEALAEGVFNYDNETYFFSQNTTIDPNHGLVCPTNYVPAERSEIEALINTKVLFNQFPELEIRSSHICLGDNTEAYITATKTVTSSNSCKMVCRAN